MNIVFLLCRKKNVIDLWHYMYIIIGLISVNSKHKKNVNGVIGLATKSFICCNIL